jgi:hypothetical protein
VALRRVFSRGDEFLLKQVRFGYGFTRENSAIDWRTSPKEPTGPLSVLSVRCAGVSANAFAGHSDARAALLCTSVGSFSTFFLRASSRGGLPFKSGYSLQDEILKILPYAVRHRAKWLKSR